MPEVKKTLEEMTVLTAEKTLELLKGKNGETFKALLKEAGIDVEALIKNGEISIEKLITPEQMQKAIEEAKEEITNNVKDFVNIGIAASQQALEDNGGHKQSDIDEMKSIKGFFDAVANRDYNKLSILKSEFDLNSDDTGTVIPEQWSSKLLERVQEYGALRKYGTEVTMVSNSLKIQKLSSEPYMFWVGEKGTISRGVPTFGQVLLVPAKLAIIMPWTTEFEEDEAISIFPILQRIIGRQVAYAEDEQMFNGTGAVFMGILNHPDVNVYTMPSTKTGFTDISADDLLLSTDYIYENESNSSVYVMSRQVYNRCKIIKDGISGGYVFKEPNKIWDWNVVKTPIMPTVSDSAADTKFIIFGDLSNVYYGVRRRLSIDLLSEAALPAQDSDEAINLATQDMKAIRVTERIAITIALPEQLTVIKTSAS